MRKDHTTHTAPAKDEEDEWLDARYEAALDQVGGDKATHLDPVTIFMIGAKWDRQYGRAATTTHTADDMDGGVTAALIEKEAEPDEGAHIGPEGEVDWHGQYLSENRRAEKAEDRADEAHNLIAALRVDLAATEARAEQAEKERDETRAMAALWKEATRRAVQTQKTYVQAAKDLLRARRVSEQETRRLLRRANDAEQERDEALRTVQEVLDDHDETLREIAAGRYATPCHDCIRDAAVIREPLMPEDITDEMVERAHRSLISHHGYGRILRSQVREALTAALTEPPARPEGAEGIEALVDAWKLAAEPRPTLPDFLAERGVRAARRDEEKRDG